MDKTNIVTPAEASRQNDSLWKLADVAEYLGVSRFTVRNYIKLRGLPYKRVGRHLRFRPEEVAAWVDAQGEERVA